MLEILSYITVLCVLYISYSICYNITYKEAYTVNGVKYIENNKESYKELQQDLGKKYIELNNSINNDLSDNIKNSNVDLITLSDKYVKKIYDFMKYQRTKVIKFVKTREAYFSKQLKDITDAYYKDVEKIKGLNTNVSKNNMLESVKNKYNSSINKLNDRINKISISDAHNIYIHHNLPPLDKAVSIKVDDQIKIHKMFREKINSDNNTNKISLQKEKLQIELLENNILHEIVGIKYPDRNGPYLPPIILPFSDKINKILTKQILDNYYSAALPAKMPVNMIISTQSRGIIGRS